MSLVPFLHCPGFSLDPELTESIFFNDTRRFSRALERLHDELKRLRDEAYRLQTSLRERYESRNLTLKVLPKIGAAAHVLTRDGVVKLEADERAHLYQKSNSTRAYVLRASPSLLACFFSFNH